MLSPLPGRYYVDHWVTRPKPNNLQDLWRSLIRPSFNLVPPALLVQFKYAPPLFGISVSFHLVEKDAPDLALLYFKRCMLP